VDCLQIVDECELSGRGRGQWLLEGSISWRRWPWPDCRSSAPRWESRCVRRCGSVRYGVDAVPGDFGGDRRRGAGRAALFLPDGAVAPKPEVCKRGDQRRRGTRHGLQWTPPSTNIPIMALLAGCLTIGGAHVVDGGGHRPTVCRHHRLHRSHSRSHCFGFALRPGALATVPYVSTVRRPALRCGRRSRMNC